MSYCPILLENLKKYEVEISIPGSVNGKPCTWMKLKLKKGISLPMEHWQNTCEGDIRYYLNYDGYVNYLSENVAQIWLGLMQTDDTPKKNFGTNTKAILKK